MLGAEGKEPIAVREMVRGVIWNVIRRIIIRGRVIDGAWAVQSAVAWQS